MAVDDNQIQEKLQVMMQDFSDNEGDDGDRRGRAPLSKARGGDRPRPSAVQPRMSVLGTGGNRRRSSIFLRRTSVGGSSVATLGTLGTAGANSASQAHLDALYKKAIRMNAENRINAANSWNLNLIEHIDKFVHDDEGGGGGSSRRSDSNRRLSSATAEEGTERRVNFTKASCTLDASIKIYSYRVDDVHLTSYKVLANLSRNDADGTKGKQAGDRHDDDDGHGGDLGGAEDGDGDGDQNRTRSRRKPDFKASGPTLESNVSNINMNKLDSAFDIDPLFHKMSKNFDEGGAKGLLLVNLGLGPNCNIVFDSSGDDIAGEESETPKNDDGDIELVVMEHMTSKLLDPEDVLMDLPLVPQLANLRAQLEGLALEGFFDDGALVDTPSSGKSRRTSAITGRRYAAKDEDEDEADVTIHQEMAERSLRLSTGYPGGYEGRLSSSESGFGGTPSQLAAKELPDDGDDYAPDDFGGGNDDYDDYGGAELVFDDIEVTNGVCSVPTPSADRRDKAAEQSLFASPSQATSHLLDKISSSSHVLATSDYEFLSARIMKDNAWAGATFWKRKEKRKAKSAVDDSKAEKAAPKKRASRKKKQTKGFVFDAVPDLSDILVKPKKQLLQWSRAVINKHSKEDNLLPLDAGFGVEKLSQLFLRPDMTMLSSTNQDPGQPNKAVEFDPAVETWAPHDDDSFGGGDDDGPGYDFGDDSGDGVRFEEGEASFVVPELKGVRKVEKVHVGYATVAKKVDVKRLKKDLWDELESHFLSPDDMESKTDDHSVPDSTQRASFQTVVHDLESSKSQPDASLPFYFICMLHLANEKGLRLDSKGLGDFDIYPDSLVTGPSF